MKLNKEIPVPIYYQLSNLLQKYILRKLQPGNKFFSERELAERYQISRVTANKTVEQLIRNDLLSRIRGQGTFVNRGPGGNISTNNPFGKNNRPAEDSIGLIMPIQRKDYNMFVGVVQGAEFAVSKLGYHLILCHCGSSPGIQVERIKKIKEKAAGLIIFPVLFGSKNRWKNETLKKTILQLKKERFPFVLIDRYFPEIKTNYVGTDNIAGAYMATKHLIGLGHQKVGLIIHNQKKEVSSVKERLQGFTKAVHECGLNDSLIYKVERKGDCTSGIRDFLKENQITAVLAGEFWLAVKAWKAAKREGLKVPDDFAIAGFDEFPEVPLTLKITTILQPMEKIGAEAVKLVIDKIKGKTRGVKKIRLKPRLVIRQSTERSF